MSICLSPFCDGEVIAETSTGGHCSVCGFTHRRPQTGLAQWSHLVGPLVVTLSGAIGTTTAPGNHGQIIAREVRFTDKTVTIDPIAGTMRVEPIARLVSITTPPDEAPT